MALNNNIGRKSKVFITKSSTSGGGGGVSQGDPLIGGIPNTVMYLNNLGEIMTALYFAYNESTGNFTVSDLGNKRSLDIQAGQSYILGDIDNVNGGRFELDASSPIGTVNVYPTLGSRAWFTLIGDNHVSQIGDVQGNGNFTLISIDDEEREIILNTQKTNIPFGSVYLPLTPVTYGTNMLVTPDHYHLFFTGGTGTSNVDLSDLFIPIRMILVISDGSNISSTNPITVDAGTGNLINYNGVKTQTIVLTTNGISITLQKVENDEWMVISEAGPGFSQKFGFPGGDDSLTENRVVTGQNTYSISLIELAGWNLSVYNGSFNSTRMACDDATTEFYSPQGQGALVLQDGQMVIANNGQVIIATNQYYLNSQSNVSVQYNPGNINDNIQINHNVSGVGSVYYVYPDTLFGFIQSGAGVTRFQLGYNGEVFMNAPTGQDQNLHLNTPSGYSRIIFDKAGVEESRIETGGGFLTLSSTAFGTFCYGDLSSGDWTFVGNNTIGNIFNAITGFQVNSVAPSGEYLRGDGTNFVSSPILTSDLPDGAIRILSTTTGINAKTVATTNLYTVPAGKTAIITEAIIRVTAANTITVVPTLGIGIAAGEDDIYLPQIITGTNATNKIYRFSASGSYRNGSAGDVIKLGIDVGATATTMTISIDLIGYLI